MSEQIQADARKSSLWNEVFFVVYCIYIACMLSLASCRYAALFSRFLWR